jgi:hypothetical protein
MPYTFEVYEDKAGEARFRFKAPNGQVMFASQGYAKKSSALQAIESIKTNAPDAETVEQAEA